jgi:hypothetical protein
MLAAEGKFDSDAVNLANKHKVYLVSANKEGFTFIGKMDRGNFSKYIRSEF